MSGSLTKLVVVGTIKHCQSNTMVTRCDSHHEETRELHGESDNANTMPGARRRERPRTAWMDNIKTWTGLTMEKSIRMAEDVRKYTFMVCPTLGSGTAEEQNRRGSSAVAL